MKSGLKMLKKILSLFLLLCFAMPSFAIEIYQIKPVNDKNIEMQISDISNIITEALPKGDYKTLSKAVADGYKRQKTGDAKAIKKYNDMFSAFAVQTNLALYELTREEKYARKAYKWSKISVEDKTDQLFSIQSNILMASYKPNLKQMTKAYDLFREVNLEEANKFLPTYQKLYERGIEIKKQKLDAKKQKARNVMYGMLLGIAAGCRGYAAGAGSNATYNRNSSPTMYNATSRQVGNTTYTTIYGY